MSEIQELSRNPSSDYTAQPLDDNLFEWHFTVRGPPDTPFEHGVYHGRIILPSEYPFRPPDIMLLTPNGRFETNKKICLSISSHHPESWMPAWGIRTVLIGLIGFLPTEAKGIGAIDYPDETRRELARRSLEYKCEVCGCENRGALPSVTPVSDSTTSTAAREQENANDANKVNNVKQGGSSDDVVTSANEQREEVISLDANEKDQTMTNEVKHESSASLATAEHQTQSMEDAQPQQQQATSESTTRVNHVHTERISHANRATNRTVLSRQKRTRTLSMSSNPSSFRDK